MDPRGATSSSRRSRTARAADNWQTPPVRIAVPLEHRERRRRSSSVPPPNSPVYHQVYHGYHHPARILLVLRPLQPAIKSAGLPERGKKERKKVVTFNNTTTVYV
ncbi:hypothetical protein IscW_ISCW007345 [Ixodes scapularis]|uniref:Uncharacterized protein n=1 Tax=Ixodes scapularis TaxID=6945 RepID=B7PUN1_IXOSC|nr:hypothetical protein IscW_ISCW007345 [Ixodes scapularis]|eukprot:XP_002406369.1 hypothetical protein IscW_ISCW007345 [Ixodes scapularis]